VLSVAEVRTRTFDGGDRVMVEPAEPAPAGSRIGVLVLSGSSGVVDVRRATWLAERGATATALRWFGGEGQPPGICEVPLETFAPAVDELADCCDRVGVLGTSKGAEAALLLAVDDPRIAAVIALAPSHVVWANVGPGQDGAVQPYRSSWTRSGRPLPFVPYDDDWVWAGDGPPAYVGMYRQSLRMYAEEALRATIPVERIPGEVVVVAGEDDQLWPSTDAAKAIADRRAAHRLATTLVTHPDAGHRMTFPGEARAEGGMDLARGGTPKADAQLGRLAWPAVQTALRLSSGGMSS
jgi:dienelactone hydrolase